MNKTIMMLLAVLTQSVWAAPRFVPAHSNLLERAQVVVIGRCVMTQHTEEHRKLERRDGILVLSRFKIEAVLKGSPSEPEVVVRHYRPTPPITPLDAVYATTDNVAFIAFHKVGQTYLIYLNKTADTNYAPVTGESDPQYSFWPLDRMKRGPAEPSPSGDRPKASPEE